jgi:hypothetical protein
MSASNNLEQLKKLASRRIKIGQDVGIDEAQRFMNAKILTKGTTPILFAHIYHEYVQWRKASEKSFISRRHFGRQLRKYLEPGKTRIGSTNYITYKLSGMDRPKSLQPAWKLLWYEQQKEKNKSRRAKKKKKTC